MAEYIELEGDEPDTWLCRCGNTPSSDGFVPCEGDDEVEPDERWTSGDYCCLRCGRVVHWDTREIVRQLTPDALARIRAQH